jgi:hypothetical protein
MVKRWAMGWMIGVLGFDSQRGLGIFLFTTVSITALGPTQTPIQCVTGALSLGVKQPGCEADHSSHLVPRSKNEWSYSSTPQYAFMAWRLVKHRDNFTFTFNVFILRSPSLGDFPRLVLLPPSYVQIFSSASCCQTPSISGLLLRRQTKFHTHTKKVHLYILIFKVSEWRRERKRSSAEW